MNYYFVFPWAILIDNHHISNSKLDNDKLINIVKNNCFTVIQYIFFFENIWIKKKYRNKIYFNPT
jgi:hypothetical protein